MSNDIWYEAFLIVDYNDGYVSPEKYLFKYRQITEYYEPEHQKELRDYFNKIVPAVEYESIVIYSSGIVDAIDYEETQNDNQ